jgi:outer membrane protein
MIALTPAIAAAQQHDPFAPLVAQTLRNNGLLQSARRTEDRAGAQVREANALYLPKLTFQSRVSAQSGTPNLGDVVNPAYRALNQVTGTNQFPTNLDLTVPQNHDSYFRFSLPLVNPAIWANRSAAEHRYDAERFQRLTIARELAARVQTAWLSARSAERAVGIREATLALTREANRVTERLLEAGRATPDAVFRARAEESEEEQQLIEARDAADAARRVVNQLAGSPLEAALDVIPDSVLVREIPVSREEAVALAQERREELHALDAGEQAAGAAVRAARGSFLPTVSLAVDYGFQGRDVRFSGRNDYVVGSVVMSWNVFNGGGDVAGIDAARASEDALAAERRDVVDKVRLDVLQAYAAAVAGRSAIDAADVQLAAARRAHDLVRRRYEEGLAPQIELIDARSALTRAELNRAVTLYRYAQRLVELERAAALRDLAP